MENSRQILFNDYEESLFRLAVFDASELEGRDIDLTDETIGDERPTERQLAQFEKALGRAAGKKSGRNKKIVRLINRAMASAAVLVIVFLISMVTVDAFRMEVFNLLFRADPKYTTISVQPDDPMSANGTKLPKYIPEGYAISNQMSDDSYSQITYTVKDNPEKIIMYDVYTKENAINIDTEDTQNAQKVMINGAEATVILKNDLTNIVWTAGSHIYYISGTVSTEEIIKMAESIG